MKIPKEPAIELPESASEAFALGWRMAYIDSGIDTAMGLLRDDKGGKRFDRELTTADDDILRKARNWP